MAEELVNICNSAQDPLANLKLDGNKIWPENDKYTCRPYDLSGFMIFPKNYENNFASSSFIAMLLNAYSNYPSAIVKNLDNSLKVKEFESPLLSRNSRYFSHFSVEVKDPLCSILQHFNHNVEYIFDKVTCPELHDKYTNKSNFGDIGVYNVKSFTLLNHKQIGWETMTNIGSHYLWFDRATGQADNTNGYKKFANRTYKSLMKAYGELLQICSSVFEDKVKEDLIEYVMDKKVCTRSVKPAANFTLEFHEGFFAEGKSTIVKDEVYEFQGFLRGCLIIDDTQYGGYTLLDLERLNAEQSLIVNTFLNYSAVVIGALRAVNLIRFGMLENPNVINIDRGLFSRTYFCELHSKRVTLDFVAKSFLAPICLFHDCIQAFTTKRVYIKTKTNFYVNTMKNYARNWRQDEAREYEMKYFGDLELERVARVRAYKRIFFDFPSMLNARVNGKLMFSEIINKTLDCYVELNANLLDKIESLALVPVPLKADFINSEQWSFLSQNLMGVNDAEKGEPIGENVAN